MKNKNRNTAAIIRLAKEKSDYTKIRVDKIVSEMVFLNEKVNFNSVSQKANVSKSWLYKNIEIRERIEQLRNRQIIITDNQKSRKKSRSEDAMIKTLKQRIKQLEKENKHLNERIQRLHGALYQSES